MLLGSKLLSHFRGSPDVDRRAGRVLGGMRKSLRTKGFIAFIALILYVALVGALMAYQRDKLRNMVEEQEHLSSVAGALARVNTTLLYTIIHEKNAAALKSHLTLSSIDPDMKTIQAGLLGLQGRYPEMASRITKINDGMHAFRQAGGSERLSDSHETLRELANNVEGITQDVREEHRLVSEKFRTSYDLVTLVSLVLGLLGAVVFSGIVAAFFSRLVWDIRKLQARAMQVAAGDRGPPIEVKRKDELGNLMEAVNRMQSTLRHREQQLELSWQQRFHHEKMAAIGSLGAAIAHEINNPIAAITGIAQNISDAKRTHMCPAADAIGCYPELILEQAKRVASITRQLAELTAPDSPEPELLDLNALAANTCNFVSYDSRFRGIDLVRELDHDLPAINAVADHLTQVLMNLLINAADALEGTADRKRGIRVVTGTVDGEVLMKVIDNGCGMDRAVLSQAFEDSFTTKPPGKGRGLGLFLCKTLVEQGGGHIELESTPGVGTTAQIHLPQQHQRQVAA